MILDTHTYDIISAVEVPVAGVQELAKESASVKGYRIGTRSNLRQVRDAVDRTDELRQALDSLDEFWSSFPEGSRSRPVLGLPAVGVVADPLALRAHPKPR